MWAFGPSALRRHYNQPVLLHYLVQEVKNPKTNFAFHKETMTELPKVKRRL
jgi:hypothetical protein